ncbi:MAG: NADPH-dependent F420 reductase [Candidatus Velthaea sp.]|jgi:predicted dinucleotide-binding enzyme
MNIGILGAGNIGSTAARLFAAAGHSVRLANSRGPASLAKLVEGLGPGVVASTPEDAVAFGDLVLIAVPWTAKEEAIPEAGPYEDKIVVDAMNPYTEDFEIEDLGERTSSEITALLVPGARLVKAFNTIYFRRLATEGKPKGAKGRLAIPVASDDAEAKAVVMALIDQIGFDAIDAGSLAAGRRQQPGTPVYNQPLDAKEAQAALASA